MKNNGTVFFRQKEKTYLDLLFLTYSRFQK